MPPKRKDFLKPNAKAKGKVQERGPQSENDFLEAADDFEQSAGKWRAGDTAKATRFFNRAIDMYNSGLQSFPKSFDLAYNKANLEYNMIEDDRISAVLGNRSDLLQEALSSHRIAIALDPKNTDVLFNTGQVLTSLAEALIERGSYEGKHSAKELLEEAVEIFTKCLASQQREYEQFQKEIAQATASEHFHDSVEPGAHDQAEAMSEISTEPTAPASDGPGEWATVVEPVTPEALLETCTAQLGALTSLLSIYEPSELSSIEKKAQDGLDTINNIIPVLIDRLQDSPFSKRPEEPAPGPVLSIAPQVVTEEETSPKDDALLAAANFQASIAEIAYKSYKSTTVQYASRVEEIFTPLISTSESNDSNSSRTDALSAYADALLAIASAIPTPSDSVEDLETQWAVLTQAQTVLTKLSSGAHSSALSPSKLADIFSARGDTDLFRFRLSLMDTAKPAWAKSKPILVNNAAVFYRGARTYAERAGLVEMQKAAHAKAAVAEILKEAANGIEVGKRKLEEDVRQQIVRVLEEMVAENLVDEQNAEGVMECIY